MSGTRRRFNTHALVLQDYWKGVQEALSELLPSQIEYSVTYSILGLGIKSKSGNPTGRFINLALLLAKRTITRRWKARTPPLVAEWQSEVARWGRAESVELKREETRGLRKKPISLEWNML